MSKVACFIVASIIGLLAMPGLITRSFLPDRKIDGKLTGSSIVFNYQVNSEFRKKLIWNTSNKLYLKPMTMPKGDLITPNYILIPVGSNVGSNPFVKRFSSRELLDTHKAAFRIMSQISKEAFIDQSKLRGIVVTYYLNPEGRILEVEFSTDLGNQISGQEFEKLENGIRSKLRFVTESADFKSGNYVKLSAGWNVQ